MCLSVIVTYALQTTLESNIYLNLGLNKNKMKKENVFVKTIDLLNEPKKIAVKVENEKEFKALMKYYDSLGIKMKSGRNPTDINYEDYNDLNPSIIITNIGFLLFPNLAGYKEDYIEMYNPDNYQIIPFSEFAAEHGIKLPLITSEDGFDLYEGSEFWTIDKKYLKIINDNGRHKLAHDSVVITAPNRYTSFFAHGAALDWIEAQKPKNAIISPYSTYPIIVYKKPVCGNEYIHLDMSKRGDYNGANIHLTIDELREAIKAYDEMHS